MDRGPSLKTPDTAWEQGADPGEPDASQVGKAPGSVLPLVGNTGVQRWLGPARAGHAVPCPGTSPRDLSEVA